MDNFLEMLKIVLPCLAVGAACFLMARTFMDYEHKKARIQAQNAKLEIVVPARMQAYERITLFLERISPETLIRRTLKVTLTARLFQSELMATIRHEYDHNISQQVYMSPAAWAMVKTATEETIRLVNVAGAKLPATAMAGDLAENILNITAQIGKFPTHIAIDNIKKEFAQYFLQYSDVAKEV
jgi:hypothetical protein